MDVLPATACGRLVTTVCQPTVPSSHLLAMMSGLEITAGETGPGFRKEARQCCLLALMEEHLSDHH